MNLFERGNPTFLFSTNRVLYQNKLSKPVIQNKRTPLAKDKKFGFAIDNEIYQPTFRRWVNVVSTLWIKTKSGVGFSTLHNVDTASVPDVETTESNQASDDYGFVNR